MKECTFEGCDRPVLATSLCEAHYAQKRRTGTLKPINDPKQYKKDAAGRECTKCKTYKPWEDYYTLHSKTDKRMSLCKDCKKERVRKNQAA